MGAVTVDQARIEARKLSGRVAAGADPRAEIVESARRDKAVLAVALDDYEKWISARKLAKVDTMMSALRRGLSHLLQKDLAELDRRTLVDAIERIEKAGKPGAARDFRKHLSAFLERQASIGVVTANALAGYRMATPTRDDRAEAEEAGRRWTKRRSLPSGRPLWQWAGRSAVSSGSALPLDCGAANWRCCVGLDRP